jgi:hypothetical protein
VKGVLDGYYQEKKRIETTMPKDGPDVVARAKLRAIVTTIRKLHVGHFFVDGNGRLNVVLMLNKLLLQEGFSPVILDDTWVFGGGFTVEALIVEVQKGMAAFSAAVGSSQTSASASSSSSYHEPAADHGAAPAQAAAGEPKAAGGSKPSAP